MLVTKYVLRWPLIGWRLGCVANQSDAMSENLSYLTWILAWKFISYTGPWCGKRRGRCASFVIHNNVIKTDGVIWLALVSVWYHTVLTHWGRVTHICVSKLTIIVSDNGLSPGRRQAIIWTKAGILLIGPLGTNFSEIWIKNITFHFKKMRSKVSSGKRRPFCLGLNVLNKVVLSRPNSRNWCIRTWYVFTHLPLAPHIPSSLYYKTHLSRQWNCLSLRCSWSIACRRCSNYIFILDLTPGLKGLGKYDFKTRWESFKFWDLLRFILEILRYASMDRVCIGSDNGLSPIRHQTII